MKIINPATEEIIKEVQEDNRQTLEEKFQSLRSAQPFWQEIPLSQKTEIIKFTYDTSWSDE